LTLPISEETGSFPCGWCAKHLKDTPEGVKVALFRARTFLCFPKKPTLPLAVETEASGRRTSRSGKYPCSNGTPLSGRVLLYILTNRSSPGFPFDARGEPRSRSFPPVCTGFPLPRKPLHRYSRTSRPLARTVCVVSTPKSQLFATEAARSPGKLPAQLSFCRRAEIAEAFSTSGPTFENPGPGPCLPYPKT
jgi:hypothetical protein